jgi:hypothetical protein
MRVQGGKQERALDAVGQPGPFRHRALQRVHGPVDVAEVGPELGFRWHVRQLGRLAMRLLGALDRERGPVLI